MIKMKYLIYSCILRTSSFTNLVLKIFISDIFANLMECQLSVIQWSKDQYVILWIALSLRLIVSTFSVVQEFIFEKQSTFQN